MTVKVFGYLVTSTYRWPTCLTYGIRLVAYLLTIMSINSCMVPPVSPQAVLLSCSTTQGSRATSDNLPAPAQDRASPTVNCSSTWRICRPKHQKTKISPWMLNGWFTCKVTQETFHENKVTSANCFSRRSKDYKGLPKTSYICKRLRQRKYPEMAKNTHLFPDILKYHFKGESVICGQLCLQ